MFSINNRIKNKNLETKLINFTIPNTFAKICDSKTQRQEGMLTKSMIQMLQNDMSNSYGYQISVNSLPNLLSYCQYHLLLKEAISQTYPQKKQKNRFMNEFSQLHSEEYVSRLFNQLKNKDKQIQNYSKIYKKQCLYDFFQLHQFTPERIITFLIKMVNQKKLEGLIGFDDIKRIKNSNTIVSKENKQNKNADLRINEMKRGSKPVQLQQNEIYYSILALKLLMKQLLPNMKEVNRICQSIKVNFEHILSSVKIKSSQIIPIKSSTISRNASISK